MSLINYDKKMIEKARDSCKDKEGFSESINGLPQLIQAPITDIVKVCLAFKKAVDAAIVTTGQDKLPPSDSINGITYSLVMSIFGNIKCVFNISNDKMRELLEMTIKQTDAIKKQGE